MQLRTLIGLLTILLMPAAGSANDKSVPVSAPSWNCSIIVRYVSLNDDEEIVKKRRSYPTLSQCKEFARRTQAIAKGELDTAAYKEITVSEPLYLGDEK